MSSRSSNKPFSPDFSGFVHVGWVQAAHGIRGEIFVKLQAHRADWLESCDRLFLLFKNEVALKNIPVEKARPHKEGLIVVLKNVNDRNQAEALKGVQVYIPVAWLQSEEGEPIFLHQVLGFSLLDQGGAVQGEVVGFASNGSQDLLRLRRLNGREALVPFVDSLLIEMDFDRKTIRMDLPPGILTVEDE